MRKLKSFTAKSKAGELVEKLQNAVNKTIAIENELEGLTAKIRPSS